MTAAAQFRTGQFIFERFPKHGAFGISRVDRLLIFLIIAEFLAIFFGCLLRREYKIGRHARHGVHLHPELREIEIVQDVAGRDPDTNRFTHRQHDLSRVEIIQVLLVGPVLPHFINPRLDQFVIAGAQLTVFARIAQMPVERLSGRFHFQEFSLIFGN